MTTFAPYDDGLGFWRSGILIEVVSKDNLPALIRNAALRLLGQPIFTDGADSVIPKDRLPALIYEAAKVLRS